MGGRRRAPALWAERAQGTVEYVALVALVALVMVGVIAALKTAQFAEGQQLGALILIKSAGAVTTAHSSRADRKRGGPPAVAASSARAAQGA